MESTSTSTSISTSSFSSMSTMNSSSSSTPSSSSSSSSSTPRTSDFAPESNTKKLCSNCQATQSPMWRGGSDGKTLCNACGIYNSKNNKMRPIQLFTRAQNKAQRTRAKKAVKEPKKSIRITDENERQIFLENERTRIFNHIKFVHEKTGSHFFTVEIPRLEQQTGVIASDDEAKQAADYIARILGSSLCDPKFLVRPALPASAPSSSESSRPQIQSGAAGETQAR